MKCLEEFLNKDLLLESPNLSKEKTNLPCNLFASQEVPGHKLARVKVQNNTSVKNQITANDHKNSFSVSVPASDTDEPMILSGSTGDLKNKDISKVFQWIKERWRILQKFWKGKLTSDEFKENVYNKDSEYNKD